MKERIERLQTLRFVAAAMVLVRHVIMELNDHGMPLGTVNWLAFPWGAGVDIFFVISGFIIAHIAWNKHAGAASAGDFLARRWIRLWPTYLIFSLLAVVAIVVLPSALEHTGLDLNYILASIFFLPWQRPGDGEFYPVLGQGWTLNYEMFFYLSFAAVLLLPARGRMTALAAGLGALVLAGSFVALPQPLAFYSDSIILEFLFGIAVCAAYRAGVVWRPRLATPLVLAGFVLLLFLSLYVPDLPRFLREGAPSAAIVAGVLLGRAPAEQLLGNAKLATLGDASYALYLSHPFVVNAILLVALKVGFAQSWIIALVAFVAAIVFSVVCLFWLERPIREFLQMRYETWLARPRAPRPADAAP